MFFLFPPVPHYGSSSLTKTQLIGGIWTTIKQHHVTLSVCDEMHNCHVGCSAHTQLPQKHTTQTQPLSFARLQAQHGHPGMSGSSSVQRADLSIHGDVAQKSASLGGGNRRRRPLQLCTAWMHSALHISVFMTSFLKKKKKKCTELKMWLFDINHYVYGL